MPGAKKVYMLDITHVLNYIENVGHPPDPTDSANIDNENNFNIFVLYVFLFKGTKELIKQSVK